MDYPIPADCPYENPVLFYAGEFGYFMSNFSAFMFDWRGKLWPTSEHAYQASKFTDPAIQKLVRTAYSAHDAWSIPRQPHFKKLIRPDWNEVKVEIMEIIVRVKFAHHPFIYEKLLQTGNRPLVENAEADAFWGRGPDWQGRNELGKIWMRLRSELQ